MTVNNLLESLKIIKKYMTQTDFDCFQSDNQIWCGNYTGNKMTEGDLKKMTDLGWFKCSNEWSLNL